MCVRVPSDRGQFAFSTNAEGEHTRIHWPRRVFAQVLLTQVAITTGVITLITEGWSAKESPAHRGRGLGLALVRRPAERYGGAVFTVVLPEALTVRPLTEVGESR